MLAAFLFALPFLVLAIFALAVETAKIADEIRRGRQ
jgi:hypothetical protein